MHTDHNHTFGYFTHVVEVENNIQELNIFSLFGPDPMAMN